MAVDLFAGGGGGGGGVKSIQSGYVSSAVTTGTGEDLSYVDVTISAVDTTKCFVLVDGGAGPSVSEAGTYYNGSAILAGVRARLTSTTNLRISAAGNAANMAHIVARWQIVEYA